MSSAANLDTNTLGVPTKFGDQRCPPPCGRHTVNRHASLTLAHADVNADQLRDWLDMLGLPPCERPVRLNKGWGAQ